MRSASSVAAEERESVDAIERGGVLLSAASITKIWNMISSGRRCSGVVGKHGSSESQSTSDSAKMTATADLVWYG